MKLDSGSMRLLEDVRQGQRLLNELITEVLSRFEFGFQTLASRLELDEAETVH